MHRLHTQPPSVHKNTLTKLNTFFKMTFFPASTAILPLFFLLAFPPWNSSWLHCYILGKVSFWTQVQAKFCRVKISSATGSTCKDFSLSYLWAQTVTQVSSSPCSTSNSSTTSCWTSLCSASSLTWLLMSQSTVTPFSSPVLRHVCAHLSDYCTEDKPSATTLDE